MGKKVAKIKRFDKSLEFPQYKTPGAIGFDLTAREKVVIKPMELALIPLNVVVETPSGHGLFLMFRSSTPIKKKLFIPNGAGVIDHDYAGDEDELILQAVNFSKEEVVIEKGERVAQAVILPIEQVEIVEVEKMEKPTRGRFGTTG